jgi:co-chaperonin GroES (HSP10)
MKLKPNKNRVIAIEVKEDSKVGGIIIETETPTKTFEVITTGDNFKEFNNCKIIVDKRGGKELLYEGQKYKIFNSEEILAYEEM